MHDSAYSHTISRTWVSSIMAWTWNSLSPPSQRQWSRNNLLTRIENNSLPDKFIPDFNLNSLPRAMLLHLDYHHCFRSHCFLLRSRHRMVKLCKGVWRPENSSLDPFPSRCGLPQFPPFALTCKSLVIAFSLLPFSQFLYLTIHNNFTCITIYNNTFTLTLEYNLYIPRRPSQSSNWTASTPNHGCSQAWVSATWCQHGSNTVWLTLLRFESRQDPCHQPAYVLHR